MRLHIPPPTLALRPPPRLLRILPPPPHPRRLARHRRPLVPSQRAAATQDLIRRALNLGLGAAPPIDLVDLPQHLDKRKHNG